MLEAGFQELKSAPGTFVVREKSSGTCAGMLCVHVDDGIWAGQGPEFTTAQNKLRKLISIKVEKTGEFEVSGRRISQSAEGIRVDQWDYLKKLTPIPIARARRMNGAALLTPSERTSI